MAGPRRRPRARPRPDDRREQLHRGAPPDGHRRDRRHPRGQPGRAPPAVPPVRHAPGPRAARHPHRSRGARSASAARPSTSRPVPRPPRRTACPRGRSSCGGTPRSGRCRCPKSATPRAPARQPRPLRLRAHGRTRSRRSPASGGPTGGSSAATRARTRRCDGGTGTSHARAAPPAARRHTPALVRRASRNRSSTSPVSPKSSRDLSVVVA